MIMAVEEPKKLAILPSALSSAYDGSAVVSERTAARDNIIDFLFITPYHLATRDGIKPPPVYKQ